MAAIEHRRDVRGGVRREPTFGALPVVARVFAALAVVAGAIELWGVPVAWWTGVTEWWTAAPPLLPDAGRAVAMVALPAAVAWGGVGGVRRNAWLWRGALLVAIVQLLRYPAGAASSWVFDQLTSGEAGGAEGLFTVTSLALSLPLAIGSIYGTWALSEGLKDAAGGAGGAVVVAAIVAGVFAILVIVPPLMAGLVLDVQGALNVLSLILTCLFVFVEALLAARAIAGALAGARPRRPWVAGALAALVVFGLPLLSFATLLGNQLALPGSDPISIPYLGAASLFGWPMFALALAAGMGRMRRSRSARAARAFVVRGAPRFTRTAEPAARGA